jgi:hypothetical protein
MIFIHGGIYEICKGGIATHQELELQECIG